MVWFARVETNGTPFYQAPYLDLCCPCAPMDTGAIAYTYRTRARNLRGAKTYKPVSMCHVIIFRQCLHTPCMQ